MIRTLSFYAMLLSSLLLCGCLVSLQPLSGPGETTSDPQLFGMWVLRDASENRVYLHVGPGEKGTTQALWVEHGKDARIKLTDYRAFPTQLAGMTLLSVEAPADPMKPKGYDIMRYRIEDDHSLSLALMSEEVVKQDIKDGKLKGRIKPGKFGDTIITASTRELRAYVEAADPSRLFATPLRFDRVPDSESP